MSNRCIFLAIMCLLFLPWMILAGSLTTTTANVLTALAWFVLFVMSVVLLIREDAEQDRRIKQQADEEKETLVSLFKSYDAARKRDDGGAA